MKKIMLNNKYELGMGFGCWARSFESATINEGDVRLIGGLLMNAWKVYPCPWWKLTGECRDEVWWTPVDRKCYDAEFQRNWVATVTE